MKPTDPLRWAPLVLALWAHPWALSAATITVTSLGDDSSGVTLREAILAANSDSGPDEIVFATAPGTITLAGSALPTITGALTITGPGSTQLAVDASGLSRVFHIAAGQTVVISGLTVSTGFAAASNGGGIFNEGNSSLTEVVVSGNTASGGNGGGIHNTGTLQMTGCNVTGNSGLNGGGIFNEGTLNITDSTLSNNFSDGVSGGGALLNTNGSLTITASTIYDNNSVSGGGVASSGGFSVVTIINSTLSTNGAINNGGAVTNFGGSWTITHSTLSANRANTNNDLVGNGGAVKFLAGSLLLKDTLVAGNFNGTAANPDDINGAVVTTSSFNIIGTDTGLTGISNGTNGNQIGASGSPIDPKLGFLQDNGGATLTHELLDGSPAIDAGVLVPSVNADQRGVTRPQGSSPDIGSFEVFVPSSVPNDLDLQYTFLGSVHTYDACNSISAAPSVQVGSSAVVSFRSGNYVVLRNGFSVMNGAEFVVTLLLPAGC